MATVKRLLFSYKIWLLILAIIGQILLCVFIYRITTNQETAKVDSFIRETSETILISFRIVLDNNLHLLNRNNKLFQTYGKFMGTSTFNNLINFNTIPESADILFERWAPKVTLEERDDYEIFASDNVQSNFSIRDVVQVFPSVILEPSENRSFYFPFSLSQPTYTFSELGGDLYNSSVFIPVINRIIANGNIASSDPVRLFQLNTSFTNKAIQIFAPVYRYGNTSDFENMLGLSHIMLIPNNIISRTIMTLGIDRNHVNMFMYDLSNFSTGENSLVYRENKNEFNRYVSVDFVQDVKKIVQHYDTVIIGDREYFIGFLYDNNLLDKSRTLFPEGILIMMVLIFLIFNVVVLIIYKQYVNKIYWERVKFISRIFKSINHNFLNPLNGIQGTIEATANEVSQKFGIYYTNDINTPFQNTHNLINKLVEAGNNIDKNIISKDEYYDYLLSMFSVFKLCIYLIDMLNGAKFIYGVIDKNVDLDITKIKLIDLASYVNMIVHVLHEEYTNIEYNTHIFNNNYVIESDLHRLSQIITIFIKNGFKYTPNGDVSLVIIKEENNIIINVVDTGIGLSPEIAKQIFKTYFTNSQNGDGFGTYYAKIIADQLGYDIGFTTQLGKGSCFYIKIPIKPHTIIELHKSIEMSEIN